MESHFKTSMKRKSRIIQDIQGDFSKHFAILKLTIFVKNANESMKKIRKYIFSESIIFLENLNSKK